jgi:hypothetical protein
MLSVAQQALAEQQGLQQEIQVGLGLSSIIYLFDINALIYGIISESSHNYLTLTLAPTLTLTYQEVSKGYSNASVMTSMEFVPSLFLPLLTADSPPNPSLSAKSVESG